jgi:AraC-like DNA-binding protein
VTLDWLHIAALLGAIQGVFLAAVLATQRRNRTANRILAVAMLAFSIFMSSAVYHAGAFEQVFPHFFGAGYPMPLLFGPLIYLYAVTASDRARRLRWWDGLHFLPFAAVVIASLPVYLMSGAQKIAFYHELLQGMRTPVMTLADPLKFVSGIAYTTATIVFLRRHGARVKDSYSSLERVNLQWLLRLAAATAAIWALATMFELTAAARADDVIALAIAILVYGIGYMALRQPEIFNFAALDHRAPQLMLPSGPSTPAPVSLPAAPSDPPFGAGAEEAGGPRYERSGLTDKEAAALKQALLKAMETDRPYQNSGLTLADLAERLDTTPHKLSEVLNSQLNQTFYDFVNAYRVQDVQRRIADEQFKNLTILSLALDAGFASKSTFNQVFKQHTGRTPSDYRKSVAG